MSSQHQKDDKELPRKTNKDKQMKKCSKQPKKNKFETIDDINKRKSSSSSTTVTSSANESKSCQKLKDKSLQKDATKDRKKRKQKSSETKVGPSEDQTPKTTVTQRNDAIDKSDVINTSQKATTSEGESNQEKTKHRRKKPEEVKKRRTSAPSRNETKPEPNKKVKKQSADSTVKQQDKRKSRESTRSTPTTAVPAPSTVTPPTLSTIKKGNNTKQHTSHKRHRKSESKKKEKQNSTESKIQNQEITSRHSRKSKLSKVKKESRPSTNVVTESTQTSDPLIVETHKPKNKSKIKNSENPKSKKPSQMKTDQIIDKQKTVAPKVAENKKESKSGKLPQEIPNVKKPKEALNTSQYEKKQARKSLGQESIASDINPKVDKLKKELLAVKSANDSPPTKKPGEATTIASSKRKSVPEVSRKSTTMKLKLASELANPPISESYETAGSLSNTSAISLLPLDGSRAEPKKELSPMPLQTPRGNGEPPRTAKAFEKIHHHKTNSTTLKPKKSEGTHALSSETTQKSELSPPMKRSTKSNQQLEPKPQMYTATMSAPAFVIVPNPTKKTNGIAKHTDKPTKEPQIPKPQSVKRKKSVSLKPNHESLLERSASDTTFVGNQNKGDKTVKHAKQKSKRESKISAQKYVLSETTQKSELSPPMKRSTKSNQQLEPKPQMYTATMSAPAFVIVPNPTKKTNGIAKHTDKSTKEPQIPKPQSIKRKKSVSLKPNHESLLERSASDTTLVGNQNKGDKTVKNAKQKSKRESKITAQPKPTQQHVSGIRNHSNVVNTRQSDLNVSPAASSSTLVTSGTGTSTIPSSATITNATSAKEGGSSTATTITSETSRANPGNQIKPGLWPKKSSGFDNINSEKEAYSRSTVKSLSSDYAKTPKITKHHKPSNTTKHYQKVEGKEKQKLSNKKPYSKRSLTKDSTSTQLEDTSISQTSSKMSHNQQERKSFRRDKNEYRTLGKAIHHSSSENLAARSKQKPNQRKDEGHKGQRLERRQPGSASDDTEQYDRYGKRGISHCATDSGNKTDRPKSSHHHRPNRHQKQKRGRRQGHGHRHRRDKASASRDSDRKASQAINTLFSAAAVGAVQSEKALRAAQKTTGKKHSNHLRYNHPPSDLTQVETAKKERVKNDYFAKTFQRKQRYNNSAYPSAELHVDDEIVLGRRRDRIILYAYITRELMNQDADMSTDRSPEWNETLDRLQTAISLQYTMTPAQETSFVRILFEDFELTTNDCIKLLAKIQDLHLITAFEAESCYGKLWFIWAREDVGRVTVQQFCEILKPHMRSGKAPFSFKTKMKYY